MRSWIRFAPLLALVLPGCAGQPPGTRSGDMSAAEHTKHAAAHEVEAEQHEAAYDPNAEKARPVSSTAQSFEYGQEVYNPTVQHLEHAEEHREIAEAHRRAAQSLEAFTAAECSKFPSSTRTVCPLMSVVATEQDIEKGAKLTLKHGILVDAVLAHMRCHHAFARHEGHKGMPNCPLYLKNLELAIDGRSVTITSDDASAVKEIQKRSKEHVRK